MSVTVVSPSSTQWRAARRSVRRRSASEGAGSRPSAHPMALSTSTPVGRPASSRRKRPPVGSTTAASIFRISIARALTRAAWPSTRVSQTGWSGTAADSAWWLGKRFSGQRFWSHPRPRTQEPAGRSRAASRTRRTTSS